MAYTIIHPPLNGQQLSTLALVRGTASKFTFSLQEKTTLASKLERQVLDDLVVLGLVRRWYSSIGEIDEKVHYAITERGVHELVEHEHS